MAVTMSLIPLPKLRPPMVAQLAVTPAPMTRSPIRKPQISVRLYGGGL